MENGNRRSAGMANSVVTGVVSLATGLSALASFMDKSTPLSHRPTFVVISGSFLMLFLISLAAFIAHFLSEQR